MKKTLTMILALAMVAAISVAGTLAYLTSTTGTVTNTFTTGAVGLTLNETDITNPTGPRVTANEYHLLPGGSYVKDPTVRVTADSEACYVFVHVENGLGTAEAATDNGTIAEQIIAYGWTKVGVGFEGYYYKIIDAATAEAGVALDVFAAFAIKGDLKVEDADYTALETATIEITAFAIQSAGLDLEDAVAQFPTDF